MSITFKMSEMSEFGFDNVSQKCYTCYLKKKKEVTLCQQIYTLSKTYL